MSRHIETKIDFGRIRTEVHTRARYLVPKWLPDGEFRGDEYFALNPKRDDKHIGSFSINVGGNGECGKFNDFADANCSGRDLIELYAYLFISARAVTKGDRVKAFRALAKELGIAPGDNAAPDGPHTSGKKSSQFEPIVPVPEDAPNPSFRHNKFGIAVKRWPFKDRDGSLLCFEVRFEPEGQSKEPRPYTYGTYTTDNGRTSTGWHWARPEKPYPLFNGDKIASNPGVPIVWHESARKAEAAEKLLPGFVHTASLFGSDSVKHADWSPLGGRDVLCCPDNDSPGKKAARTVAELALRSGATSAGIVIIPNNWPKKWDCADPLPPGVTAEMLHQMILDAEVIEQAPVTVSSPVTKTADGAIVRGTQLTDMGNAERFVLQHGENVRYCHAWGCWLRWDGKRWKPDKTGRVIQLAKKTVRSIYGEIKGRSLEESTDDIVNHAKNSEKVARLKAMIELAKSEPGIAIEPGEMDLNPYLFNTQSGTIDLETGEVREHRREDILTKCAPVEFDERATCPEWLKFLDRIMDGDHELIAYLQRAWGSLLLGKNPDQKLFLTYGRGANGKSTALETIRSILGPEYAKQTDFTTFLAKNAANDGPRDDIARLAGARFVVANEAEEGRRLSTTVIKQITGGDMVCSRLLYNQLFEYRPGFKIWLSANHKPIITQTDEGIWRRIELIPFSVHIPKEEQNPNLVAELSEERTGILKWLYSGCLDWMANGLRTPDKVSATTAAYRAESDPIGKFLEEACHIRGGVRTPSSVLLTAYNTWAAENNEPQVSAQLFGRQLKERGFESKRGTGGSNGWLGIQMKVYE